MKKNQIPLYLTIFNNLIKDPKYHKPSEEKRRPRIQDLEGIFKTIVLKLKSGSQWKYLTCQGNFSISTVFNYYSLWVQKGLFYDLWTHALNVYSSTKRINWKYQAIDSSLIKCKKGGTVRGPNSCDRGRSGSKISSLVDKNGIPLACVLTPANVHDSRMVEELLSKYVLRRPVYQQHMNMDTGYDSRAIRTSLENNNYIPHIPRNRRNNRSETDFSMSREEKIHYRERIKVEHYFGILKQYRGLTIRYEVNGLHFEHFVYLANLLIVSNRCSK